MNRIAENLRSTVQTVREQVPAIPRKTAIKYGLTGFIASGFIGAVWSGGVFGMWAFVSGCSICFLAGTWTK